MSKYEKLWQEISMDMRDKFTLTYDEIENIGGVAIDHSFLNAKKELNEYGFSVGKISLKNKTVDFERV